MRALSSAVLLVLMLGSCGLKAPIYIPKDPLLCLGCFGNKEKSKVEGQKKTLDKEKPKVEGQEEPIDKEKFKYIPKIKGQKN
jgi:predicted small lipoprotein YifL